MNEIGKIKVHGRVHKIRDENNYYNVGSRMSIASGAYTTGFTESSTELYFSIVPPKRICNNVQTVTISKLKLSAVAGGSWVYGSAKNAPVTPFSVEAYISGGQIQIHATMPADGAPYRETVVGIIVKELVADFS